MEVNSSTVLNRVNYPNNAHSNIQFPSNMTYTGQRSDELKEALTSGKLPKSDQERCALAFEYCSILALSLDLPSGMQNFPEVEKVRNALTIILDDIKYLNISFESFNEVRPRHGITLLNILCFLIGDYLGESVCFKKLDAIHKNLDDPIPGDISEAFSMMFSNNWSPKSVTFFSSNIPFIISIMKDLESMKGKELILKGVM